MFAIEPHDTAALEAMTTRQLLGHLSRLRSCEESLALSDLAGQPLRADYAPASRIYFKDDPRWREQWDTVKRILDGREHVVRPPARREASLQRKKSQEPRKKTARTKARRR
jgi:hypothetical protein